MQCLLLDKKEGLNVKKLLLMMIISTPVWADVLCANLTTAFSSGTCNSAFFQQIAPRPTGSGVIDPFVRLDTNLPIEEGLNTDARPYAANNDAQTTATFDHSELESMLVVVPGGTALENGLTLPGPSTQLYLKFLLDINQTKATNPSLLSLDELVVTLTNNPNDNPAIALNGSGVPIIPTLSGNVIYNLDGGSVDRWIALNYALNSGSGSGDVFAFIPVTLAQIAACGVGCDVELYSAFGVQGAYNGLGATQTGVTQAIAGSYSANDGYEEWSAVTGTSSPETPEISTLVLCGAGLIVLYKRWLKLGGGLSN
jgi:hypothetical protein